MNMLKLAPHQTAYVGFFFLSFVTLDCMYGSVRARGALDFFGQIYSGEHVTLAEF